MRKSNETAALVGVVITALLLVSTAIIADDLILTADTGNNRIQVFNASGDFMYQWGKYGKIGGEFSSPAGIASGAYIYAADTGNHRIQTFSFDGTWVSTWGGTVSGQAAGMFSSPSSLAVNIESCSEYVYVADTGNNRIQKFSHEGIWIASWGGPGKFNNPQGVSTDPSGMYIYVADTGNNKIQKLDTQGNVVMVIGGYGTVDGKFKYPRDVAVDSSGRIYVADNQNYRIQRFSSSGVFELKWGTKGTGNGQFYDQYGVAVDGQDNIYAADSGNNRVQVFTAEGQWMKNIGSVSQGIDAAEFYYPMGVDVHFDRHVNPECVPTLTFTETYTETATDTVTETPTDTATETYTETFTETPTDTATETYTETFTETPTDTATETYTETPAATNTPLSEKTMSGTPSGSPEQKKSEVVPPEKTPEQIPDETATSTVIPTAVATPAATQSACSLCYSVELRGKVKKTCDMPVPEKAVKPDKKEECGNRERVTVQDVPGGGYVYVFKSGSLKISVYDRSGCYVENILEMHHGRNGKSDRHFTAWYVKHLLKKNVHPMIPAEYYVALLFPSSGYMKLDTKGPYEYEEMSAINTYNYPNPCSGRTAIRFALPESRAVDIVVSDVTGRLMWQKHLLPNETIPGVNYVLWEGIDDRGTQLANGTYILRVMSAGKIVVKKISIVR